MDLKREKAFLNEVYGKQFKKSIDKNGYVMHINKDVLLNISLPKGYPKKQAASYSLIAPTLNKGWQMQVYAKFEEIKM